MLDTSSLYVTDENGNEKRMEILFTFDDEEKGNKYVVFEDPDNEDGEVFASRYDDEETYCQSKLMKNGQWWKKS